MSQFEQIKSDNDLREVIKTAVSEYSVEVRDGKFPNDAHSFEMKEEESGRLYGRVEGPSR